MKHFFTVDVEEYFQVNAFEDVVSRDTWPSFPSRIVPNIECVLEVLSRFGVTGTFFTLGWVAKRHPRVVTRIAAAGHEIASHGWWHRKVTSLTVSEFREDVRSTKALLEDITGKAVVGYRAPSFSIVPGKEWAFDVLIEEGYEYDSSLFPVRRTDYGYPDAPPIAHLIERPAGRLCEFPLATLLWNGVRIPAAGGGYLRHFPYNIIRRAFREHTEEGLPAVFYIHPWELDPEQPRLPVPLLTKFRHYSGLRSTEERLERLLGEFRFTSLAEGMVRRADDPPVHATAATATPVAAAPS
jgi:polysaccharide deacetylase family protein (PEP-CTERM system associated)